MSQVGYIEQAVSFVYGALASLKAPLNRAGIAPCLLDITKRVATLILFIAPFALLAVVFSRKDTKKIKFVEKKIELPLVVSGITRKGSGEGTKPNFVGIKYDQITSIDTKSTWAGAFACCIHTDESEEEILKCIQKICEDNDNTPPMFKVPNSQHFESKARLYNNLVKLHDALPGDSKAKEAKIYFTERLEKTLLPLFLKEENVDVSNLVFTLVEGENCDSEFQSKDIDFTKQLQFVGIGTRALLSDLFDEIETLSTEVFNTDILENLLQQVKENNPYKGNHLMSTAWEHQVYYRVKATLLLAKKDLEENGKENFNASTYRLMLKKIQNLSE